MKDLDLAPATAAAAAQACRDTSDAAVLLLLLHGVGRHQEQPLRRLGEYST